MAEPHEHEPRVPHAGPARLVARVVARSERHVEAIAAVPRASPFRSGAPGRARVPACLAIEMAAQAAAVLEHAGAHAPENGSEHAESEGGWLVVLRDVRLFASEVDADASFAARVELAERADALRAWRFEVRASGALVADGVFLTYDPRAGGGAR